MKQEGRGEVGHGGSLEVSVVVAPHRAEHEQGAGGAAWETSPMHQCGPGGSGEGLWGASVTQCREAGEGGEYEAGSRTMTRGPRTNFLVDCKPDGGEATPPKRALRRKAHVRVAHAMTRCSGVPRLVSRLGWAALGDPRGDATVRPGARDASRP